MILCMDVYGAIVFGGDAADLLDAEAVIFVVGLEGYKIAVLFLDGSIGILAVDAEHIHLPAYA